MVPQPQPLDPRRYGPIGSVLFYNFVRWAPIGLRVAQGTRLWTCMSADTVSQVPDKELPITEPNRFANNNN